MPSGNWASFALLGFLLRYIGRWTAGRSFTARCGTFAALLAFPPLLMTFQLGQVSLFILVCLLGFYDALRTDRPRAAAVWFVLGTIKPQLFLVPAVTLVAARRWRSAGPRCGLARPFGAWPPPRSSAGRAGRASLGSSGKAPAVRRLWD